MVYVQTAQLLEMDSFLVALYDGTDLTYPLYIRQGKQEPARPSDEALIQHVLRTRYSSAMTCAPKRNVWD
jgi:hypothetical protein